MPFLARESTPGAVEELQPHGEEMEDVKESNTHMVLGAQNNKVSFASIEHLHEYATNVDADATDGVECTSQPPSPPSSGAATPILRIQPCPIRLRPLIPPPNFGACQNDSVFRSAFPQDRNIEFLKTINIRSVLCLVGSRPSDGYIQWIKHAHIKRFRIDIAPNKNGQIKTTRDSLCEALLRVMDSANYPLYIHCNQGRHRTGCVVACFRKIQRWPMQDIRAEYEAYANPKARIGDLELIRNFDPECVYDYAKTHGYLENQPFMRRMDSTINNIDTLAQALACNAVSDDLGMDISGISGMSAGSSASDDGLEIQLLGKKPPANSECLMTNNVAKAELKRSITKGTRAMAPIGQSGDTCEKARPPVELSCDGPMPSAITF